MSVKMVTVLESYRYEYEGGARAVSGRTFINLMACYCIYPHLHDPRGGTSAANCCVYALNAEALMLGLPAMFVFHWWRTRSNVNCSTGDCFDRGPGVDGSSGSA